MPKIVEQIVKKDRMYARIERPDGTRHTIPRAIFVWLQGNPSFKSIPKGYVIHHLDHDKFNDDISNLALMYKFHHIAHHWKNKTDDIPVVLKGEEVHQCRPMKRPKVYLDKKSNHYYLQFRENNKTVRIYQRNNEPFSRQEDAEKYADELWDMEKGNTAHVLPTKEASKC